MDLIKLLPILFVVAQGDGRTVGHPQQLLPVIPGYVPVYIQQGPDVEVIYESGRKAAVHDSAVGLGKRKVEDQPKEVSQEEDLRKKQEGDGMVHTSTPKVNTQGKKDHSTPQAAPAPEQHNSISGDSAKGVGTIQEVSGYQVKERK